MRRETSYRSRYSARWIVLLILCLPCAYLAGYLLLLDPMAVLDKSAGGIGVGHREANYRAGGSASRVLFAPIHSVDRLIRPDHWNSYSTLDDSSKNSAPDEGVSEVATRQEHDRPALESLRNRGVAQREIESGTALDFGEVNPTDADLKQLRRIPDLTELHFGKWADRKGPTDEQLVHLSELTQLRHLVLNNTKITDEGLKHLLPLRNLEHLDLGFTPLSYDKLAQLLKAMPKLRFLYIDENPRISVEQRVELEKLRPGCQVIR